MTRLERCVCGRDILVRQDHDPEKVYDAVRVHNATPEHTAWRLGMLLKDIGGFGADGQKVKAPAVDAEDECGETCPAPVDTVVALLQGTPNDGGVSQHIVGGPTPL